MTSPKVLWASLQPQRYRIVAATVLSILQALFLLPAPLLLGAAFETALPEGQRDLLVVLGLGITVLVALSGAAGVGSNYIQIGTATRLGQDLRTLLFRRIFEAPREMFDHHLVSDLQDQVVQDSQRTIDMYGAVLNRLVPDLILTGGVAIILLVLDWRLALITLLAVPVLALVSRTMMRRQRPAVRRYHGLFRDFGTRVLAVLRSQDRIRIAGAEGRELDAAESELRELHNAQHRFEFIATSHTATQQAVVGATGALLLVAGGVMVIDEAMTIGELISFYAAFALLRQPAGRGTTALGQAMAGWQAHERLVEFIYEGETAPYDGSEKIELTGNLSMRGVSFGYDPAHPVIENLSLSVAPGCVTALVGPNGSGKSTVVNLLLGFYRPDSGLVCADERPYDEIDLHNLRMQMGVVRQEPFLMPGTVLENITYGTSVDDDELRIACAVSGADGVIASLPHGVDTVVGDDGHLLSGGQRQRLAIARAMLGTPNLLILDEPTNHLDERAIGDLLERIAARDCTMTVLVISHQRAIVDLADHVIELAGQPGEK